MRLRPPRVSPRPGRTCSTPRGRPASCGQFGHRAARSSLVCSAGLTMTLLQPPQGPDRSSRPASGSGKFQGRTAADDADRFPDDHRQRIVARGRRLGRRSCPIVFGMPLEAVLIASGNVDGLRTSGDRLAGSRRLSITASSRRLPPVISLASRIKTSTCASDGCCPGPDALIERLSGLSAAARSTSLAFTAAGNPVAMVSPVAGIHCSRSFAPDCRGGSLAVDERGARPGRGYWRQARRTPRAVSSVHHVSSLLLCLRRLRWRRWSCSCVRITTSSKARFSLLVQAPAAAPAAGRSGNRCRASSTCRT